MRKQLASLLFCCCLSLPVLAQQDSTIFRAYLYNQEYDIYMRINFYRQNIIVPWQQLFGEMPGYLSRESSIYCWLVASVELKDDRTALLEMVNDYGSEDLTAQLTQDNDSVYTLRCLDGSALKMPKDKKWQKLPKVLTFIRQERPAR